MGPIMFTALFAALGAISVGVVTVNPGALRGTGACITGEGVMDTSATSSCVGGLLDLSLVTALFASLGAISVGVVAVTLAPCAELEHVTGDRWRGW